MSSLWVPRTFTDPPSLPRAPKAPDIFDHDPHRNRGMQGIPHELEQVNDNVLIATAVELGMKRVYAEQCRTHPQARFNLLQVWCDVQDAAEGDGAAKERIDYYRWAWERDGQLGEEIAAYGG